VVLFGAFFILLYLAILIPISLQLQVYYFLLAIIYGVYFVMHLMFQKTKHIYLVIGALILLSGSLALVFAGFAQYHVTTQESQAMNGLLLVWIIPWGEELWRFTLILIFYDLLSLHYRDHLWKMAGAIVFSQILFTAAHYNVYEGIQLIWFFIIFICYSIPIILFENLSTPLIAHVLNNYLFNIYGTDPTPWRLFSLIPFFIAMSYILVYRVLSPKRLSWINRNFEVKI